MGTDEERDRSAPAGKWAGMVERFDESHGWTPVGRIAAGTRYDVEPGGTYRVVYPTTAFGPAAGAPDGERIVERPPRVRVEWREPWLAAGRTPRPAPRTPPDEDVSAGEWLERYGRAVEEVDRLAALGVERATRRSLDERVDGSSARVARWRALRRSVGMAVRGTRSQWRPVRFAVRATARLELASVRRVLGWAEPAAWRVVERIRRPGVVREAVRRLDITRARPFYRTGRR